MAAQLIKTLLVFLLLATPAQAFTPSLLTGAAVGADTSLPYTMNAEFTSADDSCGFDHVVGADPCGDATAISVGSPNLVTWYYGASIGITSNEFVMGLTGMALGTGVTWETGIPVELGLGSLSAVELIATTGYPYFPGWGDANTVDVNADICHDMYTNPTGNMVSATWAAGGTRSSPLSEDGVVLGTGERMFASILGGFDPDNVYEPYYPGATKANYEGGASHYYHDGTNWQVIDKSPYYNAANCSTVYRRWGMYSTESRTDWLRLPDYDFSAIVAPDQISVFGGSAADLSAYTPEAGGTWTEENSSDWDTDGSGGLTLTTSGGVGHDIATYACDDTPFFGFNVDNGATTNDTDPFGMIVRGSDYTNGAEDYWYIRVDPDGDNSGADVDIIEMNNGTPTSRASGSIQFIGGQSIRVWGWIEDARKSIYSMKTSAVVLADRETYTLTSYTFNSSATECGWRDEGNTDYTLESIDSQALISNTKYDFGGYDDADTD